MDLAWELLRRHPRAAARTLEELPATDAAAFLRDTPAELGATALSRMTLPTAARAVAALEPRDAAALLRATDPNVGASILRHVADPSRAQVIGLLPARTARVVQMLLRHDEDTVGAWMAPHIAVLPDDVTVEAAVKRLRHSDKRDIARAYVVDRDRRLRGVVTVWNLFNADRDTKISGLVRRLWRTLAPQTQLTAVLDHPGWNDADELPIVGTDGSFLGVLRHVDMIRAVRTRFPETRTTGFSDGAIEVTADVWQGMSQFLEIVTAIATEPAREKKG